jgi:hypothetical protein
MKYSLCHLDFDVAVFMVSSRYLWHQDEAARDQWCVKYTSMHVFAATPTPSYIINVHHHRQASPGLMP